MTTPEPDSRSPAMPPPDRLVVPVTIRHNWSPEYLRTIVRMHIFLERLSIEARRK